MKQRVFISLVSGLRTICSCLSHQYHLVKIKKNWTEAQSYCRENHIDLATVENEQEMEVLMGVVGSGYNDSAWIGLYDDVNSWQWSTAGSGFYNKGEIAFWNWDDEQPDNYLGNEHCVHMRSSGKWNDVPCNGSDKFPFFCYDGGAAQGYILVKDSMTWGEAQAHCRKNHTDLVSVRNQSENQEILEAAESVGGFVLISLFRESWKWSDRSSSSYRNWKIGEPNNSGGNEACVEVKFGLSGEWDDIDCESKRHFICYTGWRGFVMRVELNTTSALNIKDPAVSQSILQQIQQNLTEQGITVLKLNWRRQPDGEIFHRKAEDEEKKEGCEKLEV